MNWKCILIGAIVFFIVTNILAMAVTGPLIHTRILDPAYSANEVFWQPALTQDPPDMAAMMPTWLFNSFIGSLVFAGLFCCFRACLHGPEWKRGMVWGICAALLYCTTILGYSGVFNLPGQIWLWWAIDGFIIYALSGAVMGWVLGRWGGVGEAAAA